MENAETTGRESRTVRFLGGGLGALLTLGSIAWAADLYRAVGLVIYTEQFLAAMLGAGLALVFVARPARRGAPRLRVPWYDAAAAGLGAAAATYVTVYYERMLEELYARPADAVIVGAIMLILVAEGLRRTAGPVLFLFLVGFVVFGLLGHFVPGEFQGRPVAVDRMTVYLALDSNALVGIAMLVTTTIIIPFVFFGNLLRPAGGADAFNDIATSLMGRYRGGPSKIAIVASGLFGTISGSAVSNVVSTGVITIPLMRRGGYPAHSAAAIEAVASTGGQLMPPMMGAAAFVMAEFLEIEYTAVVLAALIPAILYYVTLFLQTDLQAARDGIARIDEDRIPPRAPVLKAGWIFVVPFAVIIVCLFSLNLSPAAAALWAAAALIPIGVLIGYRGKRMRLRQIAATLSETGTGVVEIVMIGATAGIVMGVLNITGLGFGLTLALGKFAGGNLPILLILAALVCIVLGMGMPTLGVYILVALLVAPSLIEAGVNEIAAHMFALYFGMMSLLTPPIAIAAFAAASVAKADAMRTGFASVAFGWSAYIVPFLFVASPELLMQGNPLHILLAFVTAVAGVWLVAAGIVGYFLRPLGMPLRGLFAIAGISLLLPATAFPFAIWSDPIGIALAVAIIGREWLAVRRMQNAPSRPELTGS